MRPEWEDNVSPSSVLGLTLTRSSHRWQSPPGSFDALNASCLFAAGNELGIPDLAHTPLAGLPRRLVAYRTRLRRPEEWKGTGLHFFLDDYRFETVWNRPRKALPAVARYEVVLTPDFSLYREWPLSLQIYNVYRSRWCGAFWQAHGVAVIPTVSWSTADAYDFCFLGLPSQSLLAVSTVGVNLAQPLAYQLFADGFREMVERLRPSRVLCYGPAPALCYQLADVVVYPTRWQEIRES